MSNDKKQALEQAFALYTQGKVVDALALLERIIAQQPNDVEALCGAGIACFHMSNIPAAVQNFSRALDLDPRNRECRLNLIGIHLQVGAATRARSLVLAGLRLFPDDKELMYFNNLIEQREKLSRLPLAVFGLADLTGVDQETRKRDGDSWLTDHLKQALIEQGVHINYRRSRAVLLLHGRLPTSMDPAIQQMYRMIWIHSHPDLVTAETLQPYDHIFCLSPSFGKTLQCEGLPVETLIGGTEKKPPETQPSLDPSLVFVGNGRRTGAPRPIISDVLALGEPWTRRLKIWGGNWEGLVPDHCLQGTYIDNAQLATLYASSMVVLNDHHEDMRRQGFLNPRLLDIMAAGGVVVSDDLYQAEAIFGDALLTYQTLEELDALLTRLFEDAAFREQMRQKGIKAVASYRFEHVAQKIAQHLLGIDEEKLELCAKNAYMTSVWAPVKGKLHTERVRNLKKVTAEQCEGVTLDIGCANGDSTALMKQHCPHLILSGAELTDWGYSEACRNHPDIRVVQADAAKLPFPDQAFDTAVLDHVIEHLEDPAAALLEAKRVARKRVVVGIPIMHLNDPDHKRAWCVDDFRCFMEGFFPRVHIRGMREPDGVEIHDPTKYDFVLGTGFMDQDRRKVACSAPVKLHLGCGQRHIPGFINIDIIETQATDLVCDARFLPFAGGSVSRIETFHMIEHLPRHGFMEALYEWNRVLEPGGSLIVECPDFEATVREYMAGKKFRINNIFGLQRHPGDFHRFGYDVESLRETLESTGFGDVRQEPPTDYHAREEPSLRITASKMFAIKRPPDLHAFLVKKACQTYQTQLAKATH